MNELQKIQEELHQFSVERDWKQFHHPKDVAISLVLEANELLEEFQWKTNEEVLSGLEENKENLSGELADTFYWLLVLAHDLNIDLIKALKIKMQKNIEKYPIEKARGNHKKYNELP